MRTDWIPSRLSVFQAFAANFAALVNAAPATYALVTGDNTTLAAANTAFQSAYTLAVDPATRTKATVADMRSKQATLVAELRLLARKVQAAGTVSDLNKTALGLTLRATTPTPIAPPATKPLITAAAAGSHRIGLRIADESTPAARKQPFGVSGCEIWYKTGTTPPVSIADCTYGGLAGRNAFTLEVPAGAVGSTCYVLARWLSTRGAPGPVSSLAQATVAA